MRDGLDRCLACDEKLCVAAYGALEPNGDPTGPWYRSPRESGHGFWSPSAGSMLAAPRGEDNHDLASSGASPGRERPRPGSQGSLADRRSRRVVASHGRLAGSGDPQTPICGLVTARRAALFAARTPPTPGERSPSASRSRTDLTAIHRAALALACGECMRPAQARRGERRRRAATDERDVRGARPSSGPWCERARVDASGRAARDDLSRQRRATRTEVARASTVHTTVVLAARERIHDEHRRRLIARL